MTIQEKKAKLNSVIKSLNNAREKKSPGSSKNIFWAGTEKDFSKLEFLSTGNPSLDKALGGGYRKGVFSELFGGPGVGKTVLGLMACKSCLDEGGIPVFISTESAQEPIEQRRMAGISDEEWSNVLYIYANGSGEEIFNRIREMMWDAKTQLPLHLFDLVVIDSIAALLPNIELKSINEHGFEGQSMAPHARMVGKFYKFMCGLMAPKSVLLSINQTRSNMSGYGIDESTGGNATKFYNKVRVYLRMDTEETKSLIEGDAKTKIRRGSAVAFEVVKNNAGGGRPYTKGTFRYFYGVGLDLVTPIIGEALELGIIYKDTPTANTNKYISTSGVEVKLVGAKVLREYFENNLDEFNNLKSKVELNRTVDTSINTFDIKESISPQLDNFIDNENSSLEDLLEQEKEVDFEVEV